MVLLSARLKGLVVQGQALGAQDVGAQSTGAQSINQAFRQQ